jgi:hypothetical protein
MRQHTGNARDAALRRLSRTNRWLIAGSVALTGILAEVAAQAFPGKSRNGASSAAARSSGAKGATHSAGSQGNSPTKLAPPAQAPEAQPAPTPQSGESSPEASGQPSPSSEGQSGSGAESSQPPPQESAPPVVSGGS